jgi:hypothetical protein
LYPGFVVPENEAGGPEATIFGDTLPASGLYVRHVDSIQLHNVCFHAQQPDSRPTFVFDDVLNSGDLLTVGSLQNCFSTGIERIIREEAIDIYPNPSDGNFRLRISEFASILPIQLAIFDISGRMVWEQEVVFSFTTLNLSHLDKGLYFLQIDGLGDKRLVVK